MLTCKEFLQELSDYLDENVDAEVKAKLEQHIARCPNCWVVCDTTKRTIKIYKGMEPYQYAGRRGIAADGGAGKKAGQQKARAGLNSTCLMKTFLCNVFR